jgi:AcrR family transcriptional regulator
MTEIVKPVIVDERSHRRMAQRLDELVGDVDGPGAKPRRRRSILETATRLFVEQGYRRTSVEQVAKAAGIAKGTLYLYYANKSQLMFASIAFEKRGQLDKIAFLFDETIAASTRLQDFVELSLLMVVEMPLTMRLVQGDAEMAAVLADAPPALIAETTSDRYAFYGGLIADAIAPAQISESALRNRVDLLAGLPYFASHLAYPHVRGALSLEAYAALFSETFVSGLISTTSRAPSIETRPAAQEKSA